ncbi:MAG: hypothetical protein WA125_03625 [Desulfosporosinus sp.]
MVSILIPFVTDTMESIEDEINKLSLNSKNIRFEDLCKICIKYFGKPRQQKGSHLTFKTPWQGDPRIVIQEGKAGKAKVYQVKQVIEALKKLEVQNEK